MSSTAFAGSWNSLPTPLTEWILDIISSQGYSRMTPVQASTIPLFMGHKDVVVEAVTGSGKTLAFVIPILEKLIRRREKLHKNQVGALVISPTRELATQIHSIFSLFLAAQPKEELEGEDADSSEGQYPPPLLLISSDQSSPAQDVERFLSTGADIVIGTPGRVEEFLLGKGRNTVNVKELEVLVLDEADRLLDLGFQTALTRIITHLPKQRRTGLFSATMTDADALSELVRVGLRNPARIVVKVQSKRMKANSDGTTTQQGEISERRIPANLQSFYICCKPSEKLVQLARIIAHESNENQSSQFIVYFSTCACVDYFYRILSKFLPPSTSLHSLHGHLPPAARTRALAAFSATSSSKTSILLATDVAARGLDLPSVDVVIQFDPPNDPKAFSHRCGRTARAGKSGTAWVLLGNGREREYVDFLAIRKIPLKEQPYLLDPTSKAAMDIDSDTRPDDSAVQDYLQTIRDVIIKDRTLYDLAAKAFVSFVRAYSKHEASYIFRLKDLNLVGVAKCFGLLRLPRMPEFKDVDRVAEGWVDADVDWSTYAYLDKAQEAKRIAKAAAMEEEESKAEKDKKTIQRAEKKKANAAWSNKVVRKDEREKRKDKKDKKRKWMKTQVGNPSSQIEQAEEDADGGDDGDDWDELAREERMAKKVKRGDVSQAAFDHEFGDL